MGLTNYYVYYRVQEAESLRPRVEKLFDRIKAQTRIQGRWMRRRDDPSTYMEVYEGVSDADTFERILQRESDSLGVERKTETFVDVPDPAGVAR